MSDGGACNAISATLNFLFDGYSDLRFASRAREQAAAANGLRNLLSRQQNSSASFLCLLRRNIGIREFSEEIPINTMVLIENIVIAK